VIVDYIDVVTIVFDVFIHMLSLPRKEKDGFLHPLERVEEAVGNL